MTAQVHSFPFYPTGAQNSGVHKWQEAEVLAVERHMMRFIKGHKVPQKDDCIQCLEAEPEALRTRSWRGVKDYVRNRITSLKHDKKCGSKDTEARTSKKTKKHERKTPQLMNLGGSDQVRQLRQNNCMQQDNVEMDCNGKIFSLNFPLEQPLSYKINFKSYIIVLRLALRKTS